MCIECLPPRREWIRYCGCGCDCGPRGFRRYLTTKEEIDILEDYKKRLQKEIAGIEERVKELKEE